MRERKMLTDFNFLYAVFPLITTGNFFGLKRFQKKIFHHFRSTLVQKWSHQRDREHDKNLLNFPFFFFFLSSEIERYSPCY